MNILNSINTPADMKHLKPEELQQLCQEIRDFIISVIPSIGGHFASSLGAVELTVAMHYVYDMPTDKIVFDVGHQGYVHKMLTGRREALKKIRQYGGISGFLRRTESPYDVFGAGHASTSISAALGMAASRDIAGDNHHVAAVIGDGSMTGGLAFEGLNNAGTEKRNVTVVLNDNEMSISPNVGAMSKYLTKMLTNPLYNRLRDEIWDLTEKLPMKDSVRTLSHKMEENFKNLLTPGMLFEDLGFKCFGPIDGHNLEECISVFSKLKDIDGPKLVHVLTRKGKGYEQAEDDPVTWHGLKGVPKPVDEDALPVESGPKIPTYSDVFALTLTELAKEDKRVCAVTAAMAEGTGLSIFREQIPERFFDVGIAEGHAVTFAAGMACSDIRPVVAIYSTFMQRAYDHMIHDVCLQDLPVVFCLDRAGIAGSDGHTHHGYFDLTYCASMPNLIVAAPKDGTELRNLMYTSLKQSEHPFAIRFPRDRAVAYDASRPYEEIPVGQWETLADGSDVALLAVGSMVAVAMQVRDILQHSDVSAKVVNARYVKPMDLATLEQVHHDFTNVITLEENVLSGGFGSRVAQYFIEQNWQETQFHHFGLPDDFVEHGLRPELMQELELTPEALAKNIKQRIQASHPVVS